MRIRLSKLTPILSCDFKDRCENKDKMCWFCERNDDLTLQQDNFSPVIDKVVTEK